MAPNPHDLYLEAQILTAPPQKLRLMLIEAALRHARQAISHLDAEREEEAVAAVGRCRGVVSELLAAVSPEATDLTRKVAAVYLFLFRTLAEAQLHRDRRRVAEAIDVLEVERETWQLVCERTPQTSAPTAAAPPAVLDSDDSPSSGFVVDA
jgi:flagellar protein FliS